MLFFLFPYFLINDYNYMQTQKLWSSISVYIYIHIFIYLYIQPWFSSFPFLFSFLFYSRFLFPSSSSSWKSSNVIITFISSTHHHCCRHPFSSLNNFCTFLLYHPFRLKPCWAHRLLIYTQKREPRKLFFNTTTSINFVYVQIDIL